MELICRAWDKACNKMYHPENHKIVMYLNGSLAIDQCWASGDFEIDFFIGKNDQSGERIFKNDILHIPGHDSLVVKWNEKNLCWVFIERNEFQHDFQDLIEDFDSCMIIGNTHQNPELLLR